MAFNNAHDFNIGTSNFNSTTNIVHNHRVLTSQPDDILHLARAKEASHRSSTATYVARCHPKTREQVITDITDWVVGGEGASRRSSPRESILWFSGPAGSGKTCIMRTVVDRCESTGLLAASYFFTTRFSKLTIELPFVATAVHQLTLSQPDLKKAVLDIIRDYPSIFDESLDFQMEELLVRPLQSTPLLPRSRKVVIVIDGLDECSEEREREHLLNLLHTLVTKLPRLITVIVASRPDFDLRRVFAGSKLSSVTKVVQLQNYDGKDDVRVFLCDEFEEIRRSHPLKMLIPEGWPLENIVQLLVDKSSGNFILPSTAAEYIKTSRQNPVDSLNIIVGILENSFSDTSNPFAELDALYWHILHPPNTNLALIKRILHCCLVSYFLKSPAFFDAFLSLPPGTTTTTLCDLHAILSVPDSDTDEVKFHHKSLEDYLINSKRSQDLFQSRYDTDLDLATICATHLIHWDANPVANESSALLYASVHWSDHLDGFMVQKPISAILPDIVLNMDPRIPIKYTFSLGDDIEDTVECHHYIHNALCSKRRCVRLCQLISRSKVCLSSCKSFADRFKGSDYEERLEALPKFSLETGLYEPVHPDSRTLFNAKGVLDRLGDPPTRRSGRRKR